MSSSLVCRVSPGPSLLPLSSICSPGSPAIPVKRRWHCPRNLAPKRTQAIASLLLAQARAHQKPKILSACGGRKQLDSLCPQVCDSGAQRGYFPSHRTAPPETGEERSWAQCHDEGLRGVRRLRRKSPRTSRVRGGPLRLAAVRGWCPVPVGRAFWALAGEGT